VSAIGRKKLRFICNRFVEASRMEYPGTGRRMRKTLIGAPQEKIAAVKRVQAYIALMQMIDPAKVMPRDRRSCNFIATLRTNALDRKLSASLRCVAISRLMLQEGFSIERYWKTDAVDDLMASLFEIHPAVVEKTDAPTTTLKRDAARRAALGEIRKNYLLDRSEGRFRELSAEDTAQALRLDGMEPVAMPEDKGERLLREFYKMYPDIARNVSKA
jgi:hypothetical protein